MLGVEVVPVPESSDGLRPETVAEVARAVRASGRVPKALYLVPNFANPSGVSLPVSTRRHLLDVAAEEDLLILEDDPYGLFGLDDEVRPALKSLDTDQRVIYLGSFAKSCFPGARVGFLVADQTVVDAAGNRTLLADELSTVKSMVTVNTSPVAQAIIGGVLVEAELQPAGRQPREDLVLPRQPAHAVGRAGADLPRFPASRGTPRAAVSSRSSTCRFAPMSSCWRSPRRSTACCGPR